MNKTLCVPKPRRTAAGPSEASRRQPPSKGVFATQTEEKIKSRQKTWHRQGRNQDSRPMFLGETKRNSQNFSSRSEDNELWSLKKTKKN